ncbi:histidine phosphatase family protein [Flavihumibacter rivuli]|uniref:SixA phosphatase family protein n=1 Tax=Flavihumibacter rivuli TaxID=2838156 RepID=UPI001BDECED2|nr:histidine phosphatase family protein [Flavihumibacter rivuli]ULQ55762.1 histidine phosphatase family protein [Flavihumibacter rivuli]
MKKLLLVRHAKSSWGDLTISDFDRPLNDRGQRNAPEMAHRLLKRDIKIDLFITSTAKRAVETATHFVKAYDRPLKELVLKDELYHAPPHVYANVISEVDDENDTIIIFGHNPGITEFVNQLTNTRIDDMPTCAIYALKVDAKHWKDFDTAKKEFWFFDSPKIGKD